MVIYFNRGDMVSFGKHLLSDERREYYKKHPDPAGLSLDERLSVVNKSDVDNWMAGLKK